MRHMIIKYPFQNISKKRTFEMIQEINSFSLIELGNVFIITNMFSGLVWIFLNE